MDNRNKGIISVVLIILVVLVVATYYTLKSTDTRGKSRQSTPATTQEATPPKPNKAVGGASPSKAGANTP